MCLAGDGVAGPGLVRMVVVVVVVVMEISMGRKRRWCGCFEVGEYGNVFRALNHV